MASGDDAIIVSDVGQHQMFACRYARFKQSKSNVTSGGLGTMGYGFGAAIGGCFASGKKRTIFFTGDGSFGMNMNEMITAVKQKLPITIVLLNNHVLGMVRQWQTIFYDSRYSQTVLERQIDYPLFAKAFGAEGYSVSDMDELKAALDAADKAEGPVLIECKIEKDERVLPMIPAGRSIKDVILK